MALTVFSIWIYYRIWRRRKSLPGTWLVEDVSPFTNEDRNEPVTIGRFRNYIDAELYKTRLDAEGIHATVFGGILTRAHGAALSLHMPLPVELRVRAIDAERAVETLRASVDEPRTT